MDDIQGNITLLEELIAYLSDAEVLLLTKEEDEVPEDLSLVEDLLKQHVVCSTCIPVKKLRKTL